MLIWRLWINLEAIRFDDNIIDVWGGGVGMALMVDSLYISCFHSTRTNECVILLLDILPRFSGYFSYV